jgi:hypothetical protein
MLNCEVLLNLLDILSNECGALRFPLLTASKEIRWLACGSGAWVQSEEVQRMDRVNYAFLGFAIVA